MLISSTSFFYSDLRREKMKPHLWTAVVNIHGFNGVLLPNQTPWRPEEMLERRLLVLRGILKSEEVYLRELDALLMVRLPNMSMSTASLHRRVQK